MMAVDHLTFEVPKKECFGLLGVNGNSFLIYEISYHLVSLIQMIASRHETLTKISNIFF